MSIWRTVGRSAGIQVLVTGLSGLLGIITSRIIIANFGVAAYGQYGLLTSLPALMPFADLGIAVVVVNNIAGSTNPQDDPVVRRTITSAFRILLVSGLSIATFSLVIQLGGWWPVLLGSGLMPGGELVAMLCLVVFGLALPLGVGSRMLVGLGRNPLQAATQGINAPVVFLTVSALTLLGTAGANGVSLASYLASAASSAASLLIAARLLRPQVGAAFADVLRVRSVPGVKVVDVAWPMLVQMISLPIAMQTGRILLSHLGTPQQLAEYNLASQLFGIALQAIATAGVALWPHYAKARSQNAATSPLIPTLVFSAAGLAFALAVCLILPFVVQLVAQGKIQLDAALVIAFVIFVTVQAAKYPVGMYMTDARGLRFQVAPIVAMIPLNLALIWLMIPLLGAAGPVLATSISVFVCQVVPNAVWVRRDLRRRRADPPEHPEGAG